MTTVASYGDWEPLLLEAGYEFAYFDGLNRYYIAKEHPELRRYFSVPVSICDPFRDTRWYVCLQLSLSWSATVSSRRA